MGSASLPIGALGQSSAVPRGAPARAIVSLCIRLRAVQWDGAHARWRHPVSSESTCEVRECPSTPKKHAWLADALQVKRDVGAVCFSCRYWRKSPCH